MRGQCFYTEDFRSVMPAEQKIHAEFLSGDRGPVRRFPGDKRVDVFLCDPINFRAGATCHNADRARLPWTKIENLYRAAECFPQFSNKFVTRHRHMRFQADRLTFFFQEWLREFGLRGHVRVRQSDGLVPWRAFESGDMSPHSKRQTKRSDELC